MLTTPVLFGLLSALTWGAGDFNGGLAVKRSNPYGVVVVAHSISLALLLVLVAIIGEPIPPLEDWLWGGAAGLTGGIGLLILYRALAEGRMSVAAPVSALLAAALPVLVGIFQDGNPGAWTLFGFILALAAVWLVSGGEGVIIRFDDLRQPIIAGITFGAFFIFLEPCQPYIPALAADRGAHRLHFQLARLCNSHAPALDAQAREPRPNYPE